MWEPEIVPRECSKVEVKLPPCGGVAVKYIESPTQLPMLTIGRERFRITDERIEDQLEVRFDDLPLVSLAYKCNLK